MRIRAPSDSSDAPATTTRSPGANPDSTSTTPSPASPSVTSRRWAHPSVPTIHAIPSRTAARGTRSAEARRPTSTRAVTSVPGIAGSADGEEALDAPDPPAPGPGKVSSTSRRRETALAKSAIRVTRPRSEEHTSELQSRLHLVCRLLLEKKNRSHNFNGPNVDAVEPQTHARGGTAG